MKKILLASTALVLSAGIAAADVAVSGSGRMGVVYDEAADTTQFNSRIRIQFDASGETDGGLTFGGSIRADNAGSGNSDWDSNQTAGSVYLAGSMWKISMGDVSGAAEAANGDLAGVGYTGLGDTNEFAYLSNDGAANRTAARVDVTFGAATLFVGSDQLDTGNNESWSVGVSYDAGVAVVGVGYEETDAGDDHTVASIAADFAGANFKVAYGDSNFGDGDQYGVSVSAPFGPTTVTAFYREDFAGLDNYGVGVGYALGGGANVKVGVVDVDGDTRADAGVTFSF